MPATAVSARGIATPAKHPLVICFTGEDGKAHEYHDAVDADWVWRFFGEGQTGHRADDDYDDY